MDPQNIASPLFRVNESKEPKFTVKRPPCKCVDCAGLGTALEVPLRNIMKRPNNRAHYNDSACESPKKNKRKQSDKEISLCPCWLSLVFLYFVSLVMLTFEVIKVLRRFGCSGCFFSLCGKGKLGRVYIHK